MLEIFLVIIVSINIATNIFVYFGENYRKDKCLSDNKFFIEVKYGPFEGGYCVKHEKLEEALK